MGCHNQQEFNKRCGRVLMGVKNEAGTCTFDSIAVAFICMSLTADKVFFKNLN